MEMCGSGSKFSKGAETQKKLKLFYATERKLRHRWHLGPFITYLKPRFESLGYVSYFLGIMAISG